MNIVLNFCSILLFYPYEVLDDRLRRQKMMFISILLIIISELIMFRESAQVTMYAGIFLWGMQMGVSQNVFCSLIAENVSNDLKGTGLGINLFVKSLMTFFGDSIAEKVAEIFGLKYNFDSSRIFGILSLIILMKIMKHFSEQKENVK